MKRSLFGVALAALATTPAFATESNYFDLKSVEVREVKDDGEGGHGDLRGGHGDMRGGTRDRIAVSSSFDLPTDLNVADLALDKIINMGKKVWAIVEAGRPVVNIKTDSANALPTGLQNWNQLEGWQMPKSKLYRATYKNGYNMDAVDFTFRVIYTYGGSAKGQGLYLTNVTVVPASINVLWGFNLDVTSSIPSVTNAGTSTAPLAAMEILVKWKIGTAVKYVEQSKSLYVRADGSFADLDSN